jgi:hypothetical protein
MVRSASHGRNNNQSPVSQLDEAHRKQKLLLTKWSAGVINRFKAVVSWRTPSPFFSSGMVLTLRRQVKNPAPTG